MPPRKALKPTSIYQLKVTLKEIDPPIWRRIEVPGNTSLSDLHLMIQAVMGWYNCHMHMFTIAGVHYSQDDPEFDEEDCKDESRFRLEDVVQRKGGRFKYLYDFGDGWEHDIRVEKISPPEPQVQYPRCLGGQRACPPEDVGGAWGYEGFLQAIRDPAHEEHEAVLEWIGGEFDPEAFDVNNADEAVRQYRLLDARE